MTGDAKKHENARKAFTLAPHARGKENHRHREEKAEAKTRRAHLATMEDDAHATPSDTQNGKGEYDWGTMWVRPAASEALLERHSHGLVKHYLLAPDAEQEIKFVTEGKQLVMSNIDDVGAFLTLCHFDWTSTTLDVHRGGLWLWVELSDCAYGAPFVQVISRPVAD